MNVSLSLEREVTVLRVAASGLLAAALSILSLALLSIYSPTHTQYVLAHGLWMLLAVGIMAVAAGWFR